MPDLPRGFLVKAPRPLQSIRYGLLSAVDPITPSDPHWEGSGVEWEDFLCTPHTVSFTDFCPPDQYDKFAERGLEFCHATPFYVKGSFECSTVGRPVSEAFEIARQRLLSWESYEVERAFWTGVNDNAGITPSLAFGNDTCDIAVVNITPGAGALSPVGGLAALEMALTDLIPFGGVIHAPYGLATYFSRFNLLERQGDRYFTPTGQSFIFGAGYPGSGPGNVSPPDTETWMFATGPVGVWRSNLFMTPSEVSEAVDRQVNNITVHAERAYAVGFSCALFAVRVVLCGDC